MNLLMDTHVWIWSQEDVARLGPGTRALLEDSERNTVALSSISMLELARLVHGEQITVSGSLRKWIDDSRSSLGFNSIPMDEEIAMKAYHLPGAFHRDPADRILVATALCRKLVLLTADARILAYEHVRTVDARI